MKKSSNKGFTLVELIIVIAILAIIMLIAIPNFSGIQQRMQVRADKATAAQIGKAIRVWFTDYTTDKTMIADDITAKNYLPSETKISASLTVPGVNAVADNKVVPVLYETLYNVDEYISLGQEPTSLREEGKTTVDATQKYGVFLTADATSTAAKIGVAITKSTTDDATGVVTLAQLTDLTTISASYDGSKSGVAYVEP